jgi:mono/diheme cytochrome c family protein
MKKVALVLMSMALVGCGAGGGEGGEEPDGAALFASPVLGDRPGCVTCHSREPDRVLVGPSLAGIAGVAATRVPGLSAEEYLRESIIDPDAFVVPGFEAGRMPSVWSEVLTGAEIEALVDYLETLR